MTVKRSVINGKRLECYFKESKNGIDGDFPSIWSKTLRFSVKDSIIFVDGGLILINDRNI